MQKSKHKARIHITLRIILGCLLTLADYPLIFLFVFDKTSYILYNKIIK